MRVQIVHIVECPSVAGMTANVRSALDSCGLAETPIELVVLHGPEDAARIAFGGSPTVLVDGEDLFPTGKQVESLSCRVYETESGLRGHPSESQIISALSRRV